MPKEYTHWSIAKRSLDNLDLTLKRSLTVNSELYYLGAVFHDTLYYYTGDNPSVFKFADMMHGSKGEDTHQPIRNLLGQKLTEVGKEKLLAFCAGMLTHIAVDNAFHPFIYYFTGDYYSDDLDKRRCAQFRHRQLESSLDIHFGAKSNYFNFNLMIQSFLESKKQIFTKPLTSDGGVSVRRDEIKNAFLNYRLARKFYGTKVLSKLLSITKPFLPDSLKTVEELSYYNITWHSPIDFTKPFFYKHPVTGEHNYESIAELEEQAVERSCDLIKELLEKNTIDSKGLSLETGLSGSPVSEMKIYDRAF